MKYNIHLDGETQGPFTGAELKAKDLPPDTPCAAESDLSWGKLEEVLSAPTPHLRLEGSAMGTLVGGVLMALWLGSILTGSGLAKLLLVIGCLGVLALGVLAIVRIRNAEENTGLALAATGMTLALAALVTGLLVNRGDGNGGRAGSSSAAKKKSSKTGGGDLLGLGKARRKANRMKCANNLKQIGTAWNGFAATNEDFPWMLQWRDAAAIYGDRPRGTSGETWKAEEPWRNALDIEMMWMAASDDIKTVKTLHSPCDPGSKENNINEYELEISTQRGNDRGIFAGDGRVNHNSQSYSIHKGASAQNGYTIMGLTRNWVGADSFAADCGKLLPVQSIDKDGNRRYDDAPASMAAAQKRADSIYLQPSGQILYSNPMYDGWGISNAWDRYLCAGYNNKSYHGNIPSVGFVGPDVDSTVTFAGAGGQCYSLKSLVMEGLTADQGQLLRSDGSASMVNDTQLKEAVQEHREAKASWIFPLEVLSQPHQSVRN